MSISVTELGPLSSDQKLFTLGNYNTAPCNYGPQLFPGKSEPWATAQAGSPVKVARINGADQPNRMV
jgi:hypothetical protein